MAGLPLFAQHAPFSRSAHESFVQDAQKMTVYLYKGYYSRSK